MASLLQAGLLGGLLLALPAARPHPLRAPFDAAVLALGDAPAVRYHTWAGPTDSVLDLRVARSGELVGTMTSEGQQFDLLRVGGTNYLKPPEGFGSAGPSSSAPTGGRRWVAGENIDPSHAPGANLLASPTSLADALLEALNTGAHLPTDADVPIALDGVPALRATTSLGELYVTREPPYRVLRLAPNGSPAGPAPHASPDSTSQTSLAAFSVTSPAPTIDLRPMTDADVQAMYGDLLRQTRELTTAVDTDIDFSLSGDAHVHCTTACLVTADVVGQVVATGSTTRITGGTILAELTATVQVDGMPAGTCTATTKLPLTGATTISCNDTAAAPVVAAADARKAAIARAQSAAQRRRVPYTIYITGDAVVVAIATIDVAHLIDDLQTEQNVEQLLRDRTGAGQQATEPSAATPGPFQRSAPANCGPIPGDATPHGGGWLRLRAGANGRSETAEACFAHPVPTGQTAATGQPVGYTEARAQVTAWGLDPSRQLARCHLIAARLGGPNNAGSHNFVMCWQNAANVGTYNMRQFEDTADAAIRSHPDWFMSYTVAPVYRSPASTIPIAIIMAGYAYDASGRLTWHKNRLVTNTAAFNGGAKNLGN